MMAIQIKKGKKEYTIYGVFDVTKSGRGLCLYFSDKQGEKMGKFHSNGTPVTIYFIKNCSIIGAYQSRISADINSMLPSGLMY